jgi:hypothetical protein
MPLPRPQPGLVIHYDYLWRHEHAEGSEYGRKRRPCAIVVAVTDKAGLVETTVAPITHTEPKPPSEGIEIPATVKRHLGLDHSRSWIVVSDLNVFIWPGFDVYPVPNSARGTFTYGFLPPALFETIRMRVVALIGANPPTRRDD